jgi:hypothetical protein
VSVVTNLLIAFSSGEREDEVLAQLRKYMHHGHAFSIVSVKNPALPPGWYGGSKHLETGLLVGAYNHLDLAALIAFMQQMQWNDPEDVQLIVKEQETFKFRVIDLFPEA